MGSASWIQEGTTALPHWHPHSTVFYQLTLYPLVNLVPFTGDTSTSQLLWRASSCPQFTLQFPTRVLDTCKVLVHQKSKHKSPPEQLLWQVLIGSEAVYSFAKSANQLRALYLLYVGISASHTPPLLKFNY